MKKYKLLKDLPLAKAGTEVTIEEGSSGLYAINIGHHRSICIVNSNILNEWLEEVKEPKTIYDLKKGDIAFSLDSWGEIGEYKLSINGQLRENNSTTYFLTEREAKRNKLLRELATRTDKWLPEEGDKYYSYHLVRCDSWNWQGDNTDMIKYHSGLVFRNEEEYDNWITEEAKDLLFNI